MQLTVPYASKRRFLETVRRLLFACLLLIGMAIAPGTVHATCWFTSGAATTVTFNAGTITLTPGTQVGQSLWTSNTGTPPNPPVLACDKSTNGGVVNVITQSQVPVNGDDTLIPTGIQGISYRLQHPDSATLLRLYPNFPTDTGTFSVPSNLELVYTGPYLPSGNGSLTGQLAQWKIDICSKPNLFFGYFLGCNGSVTAQPVETFNINATILIQVPTCNVDPGSANKAVTLPGINTVQLSGQGTTAGNTPFSLQLTNCPTNLGVVITLSTANPQSGATGVIAPTTGSGYAGGVGVQILKADGATPVTFDTPFSTGTTSSSGYAINLYARYYQTGATVSAGSVKGIATYTLNYQ